MSNLGVSRQRRLTPRLPRRLGGGLRATTVRSGDNQTRDGKGGTMGKDRAMIIAIDVGSCHVRVLAAQELASGGMEILAMGETPSLGVQRGTITNVDDASFAIKEALNDARVMPWLKQSVVYASLNGKHISSSNQYGEVKVSRSDSMVNEGDVERALEVSRSAETGKDSRVVHSIPRAYRVGGYLCRRNPIGLRGPTVGADSHVITADAGAFDNLHRAALMAGKELDGVFIGGLAAAHAVLTPAERDAGTLVIDIGGGTTEVVAYSGGTPFRTFVLPVGGNQIAGDLAIALNTPVHVAERLFLEEGTATMEGVDPAQELTIRCFGPTGSRHLRRGFLHEVIRLRLEEILRMAFVPVMDRAPETFDGTVVLTGGVAGLRGISALAAAVLETPVRVGSPLERSGAFPQLSGSSFATAVGILRLATDTSFGRLEPLPQRKSRALRMPQWKLFGGKENTAAGAARGQAASLAILH